MYIQKRAIAHVAVLAANVIYGFNFVIAKGVMPEYIGPIGFTALRVLGAGALFWLLSALRTSERVERRDLVSLFVASLFGVCINQISFFVGLSYTTPINAAIVLTSAPIVVLLVSALYLKTRITLRKTIGIALGMLGAGLVITQGGQVNFGAEQQVGNLLMLLNATSFAFYMVYVKRLMEKYKPETVVRWVFTFSWLTVVPLGVPDLLEVNWHGMTIEIFAAIAYVIVFTTFLTYLFNNFGIKHAGPTVVSTYVYSQPIIASVVAVALGAETIDATKILAAVLVCVGVYFVSAKSKNKSE